MSHKFDTVLDDCLDLLRAGTSLEDCLTRYPEHADDLRPLLSLASAVRGVPTPRPDAASVETHRMQMLDAVRKSTALNNGRGPAALGWLRGLAGGLQVRPLARTALMLSTVLLLIGLAAGTLTIATTDTLPGQALYPLKRLGENIRLSLTLDPAALQQLRSEYRLERQREVRLVLDAHLQTMLEFRGELQEIGEGFWIVGGLVVHLEEDTVVEGQPVVGAMVVVQASSTGDGILQAAKLRVLADPMLLTPVVTVTPTPTPSPTPTVTMAPSATPTATTQPSITPTATATPSAEPTATPTPSTTPTITASPWPTVTDTPAETEEAEPTEHPEEHETDDSEATDYPDEEENEP